MTTLRLPIAAEQFGYKYEDPAAKQAREKILKTLEESDASNRGNSFSEIASEIELLWEDSVTKGRLLFNSQFIRIKRIYSVF